MFERLFGETVEEQLNYLRIRVWITAPVIIIGFLMMAFGNDNAGVIVALAAYVWAWTFLKNWFGLTSIGAIFSGNVVIGLILFIIYLFIGYFIGLFTFLIGLIRYIYIVVALRK